MKNRISKNTKVTWTSSGRGSSKTKTGTVVRFVDAGVYVRKFIPKKVAVSKIMTRNYESKHRRYLVVVTEGEDRVYYTPRATTIEKQAGFKAPEKAAKKARKKPLAAAA